MTSLRFAGSESALLKGTRALVLVAPAATFRRLPPILDESLRDLAEKLARDVRPGDNGAFESTLTGSDRPRQLRVAVLPDHVSRHNSEARAESIRNVIKKLAIEPRGKTAVLLVLDDPAHLLAAANAVGRALPLYSRKRDFQPASVHLLAVDGRGKKVAFDRQTRITVDAARESAKLVDVPPTEMDPAALAKVARETLAGLDGVRIKEIVGGDLLRAKLGGIHGVGRCASSEPRMLIASWRGTSRSAEHVALVGKGVTYDTGGLNIKTGDFMSGMKGDMGGAAAVLGAFRVLAATRCKHKVSLVLCIAENAIGPDAYKPDDVLEMHSGLTVEINNTDAEGRLLLADGVSWAARKLGADTIFDAATLTGAQLIATGRLHAAIVSNDADLERLVVDAGRDVGDLCHPLPFAPELYRKEFTSQVADLKNSVADRKNAQSSCAAQFVYSHIEHEKVRWCHVDLAGPAKMQERGTGYGVALLSAAVRKLASG